MVIAALWILKAGHKYDAGLDTRYAVGNRIRRRRPNPEAPIGSVGNINLECHSIFEYCPAAYAGWRERGLRAMRTALEGRQRIVAITMDLKKFYHRIDAGFLLNPSFLEMIGIVLTPDERLFTEQLIAAISTWNHEANLDVGLPVGLTASGLIANVLLKEFDQCVVEELTPVYYGRYVDDVSSRATTRAGISTWRTVFEWLAERLGTIAEHTPRSSEEERDLPSMRINLPATSRVSIGVCWQKAENFSD